MRLKMKKKI